MSSFLIVSIATIAILIVLVGLVWTLLRFLKGVFDLGRKTAKYNPWQRSKARSPSRLQDAATDRIRVPLHENDTDLIAREASEGEAGRPTRRRE